MATVYRDPRARPKINYITTAPFDLNFYNYTQSTNPNTFEVTGALSAVSGVSPSVCPKGRVLRENGKRLFPGGSYPGISTFMVGVYDANSGLSGYIDPNAECFAYYNVDKPVEVVDGVDPSGNVLHRGPSVYTSGNILADGSLKVGSTTDLSGALTVASGGATITAGGLTVTAGGLTVTAGVITLPTTAVGVATLSNGTQTVTPGITLTANARIFVSRKTLASPTASNTGLYLVGIQASGTTFTITSYVAAGTVASSDNGTVNWLIVNP